MKKFIRNLKSLKLERKNNHKIPLWVFLCKIMKKTIAIFEISTLEFVKVKKSYLLGQSTHYLGTFKLELGKPFAIFEISTLKFFGF